LAVGHCGYSGSGNCFANLGFSSRPFDVGWPQFVGLVDEGLKAGHRQPSIEAVEARRYQSIEVVAGPHLIGDRKPLAAVANVPRNDQLGVGINAGPSPNVASRLLGALGELNVLLLGVLNDQISSHYTALAGTLRTIVSWKAAQAWPRQSRASKRC